MHYFGSDNYYETTTISIIGESDIKILLDIYLPIIGFKAFSLYRILLNDIENNSDINSIDNLCTMTQFTLGDLSLSSAALEGMGLLKTYLKEENGIKFIKFVLYPPKAPRDFFDDILFNGILIHHVGLATAQKLALRYQVDLNVDGYNEISSSFVDVYNPDFDDPIYGQSINVDIKGRKKGKIATDFDIGSLMDALDKSNDIKSSAFSKKEIKEIERIATLYNLDELTMVEIVSENFNINEKVGQRLNVEKVIESAKDQSRYLFNGNGNKKRNKSSGGVSSNSEMADLINLAVELSPTLFLGRIQGGIAPAKADLNLIETLSSQYQLTNEVVNILVSYVLQIKNNQLPRAYTEKIAATLVRANIETAIDAVGFLNNSKTKTNKTKSENTVEKENTSNSEEEYSAEELRKLLEEMGD